MVQECGSGVYMCLENWRYGFRVYTHVSSCTQSPDASSRLLISELCHIFPPLPFPLKRIKTQTLFSSSLCYGESESPKFSSLAQVTSWLIFKRSKPREDKRPEMRFHISPPTDTITATDTSRSRGDENEDDREKEKVESIERKASKTAVKTSRDTETKDKDTCLDDFCLFGSFIYRL